MMLCYFIMILFATVRAQTSEPSTGSCKDMLQGYLTGQLSSALGTYQVEALRREFKSFTNVTEKAMKMFKEEIDADMERYQDARNKSIVYTRWGQTTCPTAAELVYSGYVGGSYFSNSGAAVDYLCLPRDPEWGVYTDGTNGHKAYVYCSEYNNMGDVLNHDVRCAVCLVRDRSVVKMFPGHYTQAAGSQYTCVDSDPETVHGGQGNKNGNLFYLVEARCGSLKCPPYVEGRELVCTVCSKE